MPKNVGTIDRIIRMILAIVIAVLLFTITLSLALKIILIVLGIILFVTSIIGFCPLYWMLKISTKGKKTQ